MKTPWTLDTSCLQNAAMQIYVPRVCLYTCLNGYSYSISILSNIIILDYIMSTTVYFWHNRDEIMLIPCISVAKLKKSACELCQSMRHGRCLSGVGHKLPSPLIFSSILETWGWTPQLHVIYPATTMLRPYSSCSSSGTCYRWWRESWSQRRNCKDFPINCNCQSWRFYQTVLHLQNHHSQQFIYNI